MNSHERRIVERRWPYAINIIEDEDNYVDDIFALLQKNLGSQGFTRKNNPRWCWRPHYESTGNFAHTAVGVQLYFRKEKDYSWFLLKWG